MKNSYLERWFKKREITKDGCWIYLGAKRSGYGWVNYRGKNMSISRAVLIEITKQNEGNKEIFSCHKCRRRDCFNPEHLYWGTRKDNVRDMINDQNHNWQNNYRKAEDHPRAKFSNQQVKQIRQLNKKFGYGPSYFEKKYGYNKNAVNNILYNKNRFKGV